jgi:hypothetical protein
MAVYLQWQDGKFKPVKVKIMPTYQNLTLEW